MKKCVAFITAVLYIFNVTVFDLAGAQPALKTAVSVVASDLPVHPFDIQVDPFSAELSVTQADMVFDMNPFPLGLTRVFRGNFILAGEFGPGWTHNYDYIAEPNDLTRVITVYDPESVEIVFKKTAGNRYETPDNDIYILKEKNGFVMVLNYNEKYFFSARGILERIENVYGQALKLEYTGGKLQKVTDPLGQGIEFFYNASGAVIKAKSSLGDEIRYEYDDDGRLFEVYVNGSLNEKYAYDPLGNMLKITLAGGFTWDITSGAAGKVKSITNPFKYETRYEYTETEAIKECTEIAPNGGKTVRRFLPAENTMTVTGPEGGTTVTRIDPATALTRSVTDPAGNVTQYAYDEKRRLVETTLPDGGRIVMAYEGDNPLPVKVESPGAGAASLKYDNYLKVVEIDDTARGKQNFKYDRLGRLVYINMPGSPETEFKYGKGWAPVNISDKSGFSVDLEYDKQGKLTGSYSKDIGRMSIEEFNSIFSKAIRDLISPYDLTQAGTTINSADGLSTFVYDNMGNIVTLSLPGGATYAFEYDIAGRFIKKSLDGKTRLERVYDPAGNIVSRTFGDGKTSRFRYDSLNQYSGATYPDGGESSVLYDLDGNVTRTDHKGVVRQYTYDGKNRLLSCVMSCRGASAALADRTKVSYEYSDGMFGTSLIELKHAGDDVKYFFDGRDRLSRVESRILGKFLYTYTSDGRLTKISYPNGIETRFDLGDFYKQKIEVTKGGIVLRSVLVERNQADLIASRTTSLGKEVYMYDERGQIVSAKTPSGIFLYKYDNWGNRLREDVNGKTTEYSYSSDASLAAKADKTYSWDSRGNLTAVKSAQGNTDLSFDYENRLTNISGPKGEVSYTYEEQGLLTSRHAGGQTVYYTYFGVNPLAELDTEGNIRRFYLYEPAIDSILGMVQDGKTYYFHRDERNNITLVTDMKGEPVAYYEYDPFGNIISRTGEFDAPFLFAALRYEPLYDLYYMRNRFYDPASGRFISADPVPGEQADALSMNPYIYVKNDPMNALDPFGLIGWPSTPQWMKNAYDKGKSILNTGKQYGSNFVERVQSAPSAMKEASKYYIQQMSNSISMSGITGGIQDILTKKFLTPFKVAVTDNCKWFARWMGHSLSVGMFAMDSFGTTFKVNRGEMSAPEGRRSILSNMTGTMTSAVIGLAGTTVAAASLPGLVLVASTAIVGGTIVKVTTDKLLKTNETAKKILEAPSMATAVNKLTVKAVETAVEGNVEAARGLAEKLKNAVEKGASASVVGAAGAKIEKAIEKAEEKKEPAAKDSGIQKESSKSRESEQPVTVEQKEPAKELAPSRIPQQEAPAQAPAAPSAPSAKVTALSAKVDKLLGKTAPATAEPAQPDVEGHIEFLKNPSPSVEVKTQQSEEFRQELVNAKGSWDFSGLVPNWDGGITTVDIPTYEEIIKWQQEQQAIAAAAALIGAAVAAGIAASQQQKSSGGGGGGSQPQQYEKSQPACGPC